MRKDTNLQKKVYCNSQYFPGTTSAKNRLDKSGLNVSVINLVIDYTHALSTYHLDISVKGSKRDCEDGGVQRWSHRVRHHASSPEPQGSVHNMFTYIKRVNTTLLFLNGLLLFFIVLTAFTTLLIANHVGLKQSSDGTTAAAFYSGNAMILGTVWSTISYYCAKTGLVPARPGGYRYLVGPVPYAIAFALSFLNAFLSLVAVLLIAGFWTLASRGFWRTALAQAT